MKTTLKIDMANLSHSRLMERIIEKRAFYQVKAPLHMDEDESESWTERHYAAWKALLPVLGKSINEGQFWGKF